MSKPTPHWLYALLGFCLLCSILLVMFVPRKKKELKNININKSYCITSDYILNVTAACLITFGIFALMDII